MGSVHSIKLTSEHLKKIKEAIYKVMKKESREIFHETHPSFAALDALGEILNEPTLLPDTIAVWNTRAKYALLQHGGSILNRITLRPRDLHRAMKLNSHKKAAEAIVSEIGKAEGTSDQATEMGEKFTTFMEKCPYDLQRSNAENAINLIRELQTALEYMCDKVLVKVDDIEKDLTSLSADLEKREQSDARDQLTQQLKYFAGKVKIAKDGALIGKMLSQICNHIRTTDVPLKNNFTTFCHVAEIASAGATTGIILGPLGAVGGGACALVHTCWSADSNDRLVKAAIISDMVFPNVIAAYDSLVECRKAGEKLAVLKDSVDEFKENEEKRISKERRAEDQARRQEELTAIREEGQEAVTAVQEQLEQVRREGEEGIAAVKQQNQHDIAALREQNLLEKKAAEARRQKEQIERERKEKEKQKKRDRETKQKLEQQKQEMKRWQRERRLSMQSKLQKSKEEIDTLKTSLEEGKEELARLQTSQKKILAERDRFATIVQSLHNDQAIIQRQMQGLQLRLSSVLAIRGPANNNQPVQQLELAAPVVVRGGGGPAPDEVPSELGDGFQMIENDA